MKNKTKVIETLLFAAGAALFAAALRTVRHRGGGGTDADSYRPTFVVG